jgi:CRP-like cAMP-binding protein
MAARHDLRSGNLLLDTLSDDDLDLLAPAMQREKTFCLQRLSDSHRPIEHVWFLETGAASVIVCDDGELQTEIAIVGREGFTATSLLLGSDVSPQQWAIQIEGHAAQVMSAAAFLTALDSSATFRALILRYAHTFIMQVSDTASSNAHQKLEGRLARWLLLCHDRSEGDDVRITHQLLALMISAERSSVTTTLHLLEGVGLIRSSRGRIMILDRPGLERLAGMSYGVTEAEYRRLIGSFGKSEASPYAGAR